MTLRKSDIRPVLRHGASKRVVGAHREAAPIRMGGEYLVEDQ